MLGRMGRLALSGVVAPDIEGVTPVARFEELSGTTAERLGAIPQTVVLGFEQLMSSRRPEQIHTRLALVTPEHRGFAYEGATMAATLLDVMTPGPRHRTATVMTGPGSKHLLLNYIGIGFALAKLPRRAWRDVLPDLPVSSFHPVLSWLVVDGYGFDLAYFRPDRYVTAQHRPAPYPWMDDTTGYFGRAVDQGIGRALWFIAGGVAAHAEKLVDSFDPYRRADLWSGVGLAATFAGGSDIASLPGRAREHGGELAVGAVFAARARAAAECVPEHSESALSALTGLDVRQAVDLADSHADGFDGHGDAPVPVYERWREDIRSRI
ncbi:DUF1702 family protein [Myceligenerans xiligouense]|uniref:Uncharacterized protein DUF1702 n=1 Tax=Myceligenerans xiligouense TaxID=253184 RepID=A0A3N4YKP2_9MICO|nr:DUF1702 family protein [Myceligenerans xiligouense]RPF19996.1 uncharacterized protein DUF1702 [Myceligenerans xiligouense]